MDFLIYPDLSFSNVAPFFPARFPFGSRRNTFLITYIHYNFLFVCLFLLVLLWVRLWLFGFIFVVVFMVVFIFVCLFVHHLYVFTWQLRMLCRVILLLSIYLRPSSTFCAMVRNCCDAFFPVAMHTKAKSQILIFRAPKPHLTTTNWINTWL